MTHTQRDYIAAFYRQNFDEQQALAVIGLSPAHLAEWCTDQTFSENYETAKQFGRRLKKSQLLAEIISGNAKAIEKLAGWEGFTEAEDVPLWSIIDWMNNI